MQILEYAPAHFELLQKAVAQTASRNMRHRGFVNYYYAAARWCNLYLLLSNANTVVGTLGVERMPFCYGAEKLTLGFGTNYYSLDPGVGGFLFLHWLKNCDVGIFF